MSRDTLDFPEGELVQAILGKKMDTFFPKVKADIGQEILSIDGERRKFWSACSASAPWMMARSPFGGKPFPGSILQARRYARGWHSFPKTGRSRG